MKIPRSIFFGDEIGLSWIFEANPTIVPVAIVCSWKREATHGVAATWAEKKKCPVLLQPSSQTDYNDFLQKIIELRPQIGLCCSYDIILPQVLLNLFPQGIYNLHGALLPQYRGANVLNWVLINGETETGVTLHRMVQAVDAGPILLQQKVPIEFEDTALTLREKLNFASIAILQKGWNLLQLDSIPIYEQDHSQTTVVRRRRPEDGQFNWSMPAVRIYNLIRALVRPWPGAFYIENGEKNIIDSFMTLEEVRRTQLVKVGKVIE